MALQTVQDYITRARALLQDQIEPYRYPDVDLVEHLNMGLMEARRLRPELFLSFFAPPALGGDPYFPPIVDTGGGSVYEFPVFSPDDMEAYVPMDSMLRPAFVYYICGHAHLRDDEITQDSRASGFLSKFTAQMLTIQS